MRQATERDYRRRILKVMDQRPPPLEIYLNSPGTTPPDRLVTELLLPVEG